MRTILAGTNNGLVELGQATHLAGHTVNVLAVANGMQWAIVDRCQLWRGFDGGWEQAASTTDYELTCVAATDDLVLVGTTGAHLLRLTEEGLAPLAGFEHADGRDGWYTPWGGLPDTRSMTADDTGVYVNVHVGGVVRSTDGGETWLPTIDVDHDVHQIVADRRQPGRLLAATGASGVAVSDDAGLTWTFESGGLHGSYCRAIAVAADDVLVTASTGPFAKKGAVYRRPAGANGAFEVCDGGLPRSFPGNIDTFRLAAAGDVVVVAGPNGTVFVSADRGSSWEATAEGLPEIRCVAVV